MTPLTLRLLLESLDPILKIPLELSAGEVAALLSFMEALTDPAAESLAKLIPDRVPSGLPVED